VNNKYIKTDREGLIKDSESGAVLNVDNEALSAYRKKKAAFSAVKTNNDRLEQLENDISDIKSLLQELLLKSQNK
jgi:hypothetical protein